MIRRTANRGGAQWDRIGFLKPIHRSEIRTGKAYWEIGGAGGPAGTAGGGGGTEAVVTAGGGAGGGGSTGSWAPPARPGTRPRAPRGTGPGPAGGAGGAGGDRGLRWSLTIRGLCRVGHLCRPRQSLAVATARSVGIGLRGVARLSLGLARLLRRGTQPAAKPVDLLGRSRGPGVPFSVLAVLRLAQAGVGRAIGDQKGRQQRGHLGTGGVVLTQEALQGARRQGLQQTPRTLVASGTGASENLGRDLAGLEICR